MTGQRRKGGAAAKAGGRAAATPRWWWPLVLASLITIIAFACLIRLARAGAVHWTALVLLLPVMGAAATILSGVKLRADYSPADDRISFWSVVLVAIAALLSLIGFLTRLSLGETGLAAGLQPLAAALGVIALTGAGELSLRYAPNWPTLSQGDTGDQKASRLRILVIAVAVIAVIGIQYFARSGHQVVRPGARSPWPVPVLVGFVIALLAVALAGPNSWLVAAKRPRWLLDRTARSFVRRALPVAAALAIFAFTRDLGVGILALFGGLGVLTRANRINAGPGTIGWSREIRGGNDSVLMAEPTLPVLTRRFGPALAMMASFAAGAWVVTLLGATFWSRNFSLAAAYGAGGHYPYTLRPGPSVILGLGFPYRQVGSLGGNAEVLVVIGRETGLVGLGGVLVLLLGLLAILFWLARPNPAQPVGSSLAQGLVSLLCAQALLVVLALFHWIPPLGPGPPLLAGGPSWYLTALVTIGIVTGLAWRGSGPGYAPGNTNTRNPHSSRQGGS